MRVASLQPLAGRVSALISEALLAPPPSLFFKAQVKVHDLSPQARQLSL